MKWSALVSACPLTLFAAQVTLTFGARGTVGLSSFTNYFYGIRLYGD